MLSCRELAPFSCSVPFLAAATAWDQTYINLGNVFLSDTTEKVLTQVKDLIDFNEPNINQDLLVANVSEKIYHDYRFLMKDVDKTYEQSVNEVFNQYKNTISSRAANGDMPDKCVHEVVRAVEQFKTRLLARTGKTMRRNIPDQVIKSVQVGLARKGIDLNKINVTKNELGQLLNDLSQNEEFNRMDLDQKAEVIQAHIEKLISERYKNPVNVYPIVNEVQSAILPSIQSQFKPQKFNETTLQDEADTSLSDSSSYSAHGTRSRRDETNRKHNRHSQRKQTSNTSIQFTGEFVFLFKFHENISRLECTDYDPYRNYAKYKAKRLHENKQNDVY
ncbi:unnamed protein product [Adineta ricciae]|uniref:Uncharacterized protein n=1 Tax=Adineta ricciae TaxID=249248 RepID=A0A813Z7J8_ADIRI|nr:unnamed protein product [Adineta ricciae]